MKTELSEKKLRESVREKILELISHMDFSYSTKLLSENQLADRLDVSRSTIRSALAELESEGKIIRRHGSGTYVNPPALTVKTTLHPSVSMYELVESNGYKPSVEVFSTSVRAAGSLGEPLGLTPHDKIIEMHSCYYADKMPAMYCVDYMDEKLYGKVNWEERNRRVSSLHEYIHEHTGIRLTWDIIRIHASHSGALSQLNGFFRVPEGEIKPLVLLEIRNFDQFNRTSLLGRIYVDTDLVNLSMVRDLSRKNK